MIDTEASQLPEKVYAIVLGNRVQRWAEDRLMEGQCGILRGT